MRFLSILCIFYLLHNSVSAKQSWEVVAQESSVGFTATYDDIPFEGVFERFSIHLSFDPGNPADGKLSGTVDITSVNTNSHDRDTALADPAWFHFSQFPQATFSSHQFIQLDDNQFQVTGTLTIRDQSREINFPFQWQTLESGEVRVLAEFETDRRDYDIGSGEWAEDETIGFNVLVKISLLLRNAL